MIIDVNASIGRSLYSKALGLADLLSEMKRLKITRAVVSPLLPPSFNFDQANRQLAEIVSQHPRKLIGLGRVDPRLGRKALRYAHNAIEQYRLHGLKLHPWEEHYPINHPMVYPVMDYAQEARVPVLIAGGYPTVSHALQILELAQA
ncbi:MAG: amidohydrolase family protein, partial [Deinococcus sp.]|nr:amidohydrolase family protein [Deinococcus sp.]